MDNSDWDFSSLEEYREWIEKKNKGKFSFKVGVFETATRACFDQHGFFFNDFIPDPPTSRKEVAKSSILGVHTHHCVNLNAEHLFEDPKGFFRQGDIFLHQDGLPKAAVLPCFWMVMSHTCTISNEKYCTLAPVYTEESLKNNLDTLGLKTPLSAIRQNKKSRLVWFPPTNLLETESGFVVDLAQSHSIETIQLKSSNRKLSFTFPGNAYLCCRFAIYQFRDVANWDDERKTLSSSQ